ncbi:hypothetical protein ABTD78_25305, partial [Acinetobacter baumannii]
AASASAAPRKPAAAPAARAVIQAAKAAPAKPAAAPAPKADAPAAKPAAKPSRLPAGEDEGDWETF